MLIQREDSLHAPSEFASTIFLQQRTNCLENSHCSQLTGAKWEIWQPAGLESSFGFFLFHLRSPSWGRKKKNKKQTLSDAALITREECKTEDGTVTLSSVESTERLVMYHYCPPPSMGLQSPRDKKQARSSNLVPQALNALFHRPHKMDLRARLHWRAKENQYPWHIMLRIILSLSNYNNLIACLTFAVLMQMSAAAREPKRARKHNLCHPCAVPTTFLRTASILPHVYNVWTRSRVSRGGGKCHWIWSYLARILMKCKLN